MNNKIIDIGLEFPEFSLPSTNGKFTNQDLKRRKSVMFVYPADSTPSCTKEALSFSANIEKFDKLNVGVVGISKDSLSKHYKFIKNNNLKINLVSDEKLLLIKFLDAWKEKSMYGKTYMGTERTTVLSSTDGKIVHIWRKVKVKGHVEDVLNKIIEIYS